MSSDLKTGSFAGDDALGEALRIYLEHRASGAGLSDSELLRRHPALRDLLVPLLEDDDASPGDIRPGAVIGDYRLVESIGRGGMGEVWEAEQISLKRRVALKLLREHVFASAHSIERFRREALAGARLQHPCIVAVHAVGESDGIHFIAQELIESRRTLSNLVREARELPAIPPNWWCDIARLFAQLADALQTAHEHGIIHRDIKPSNILITEDGAPKLVDFGLAMVAGESDLSRTGDFSGSPFYMSPEQAAAKRAGIDARSDVFSLGATLFEALTLQRPFEGDTVAQVLTKILFHDPRDPREIRSLCPRDLAVICMKMLEKSPVQRYASMRAVADELERHLRNEPIRARPPGMIGWSVKWARRHPVLAASGAILCVSLGIVTGLLFETIRARKAAEKSASAALVSAEQARVEGRTSSRITDFLVEAFVEASPTHALGREVTAREVLDRGVDNIRAGLTEAAEAGPRARLLGTFGMVYSRLGLHEVAEDLLLEAGALGAATFGPRDPRTLESANELARLYLDTQRFPKALELDKSIYEARLAQEGPDSVATLRAESNLGTILTMTGDFEAAERHLRHALEGLEQLGEESTSALFGLAEVQRFLGQDQESLSTLQQCVEQSEARRGAEAPDTLTAREAYARQLNLMGDVVGAARLYRELATVRECILGAMHPMTIGALSIAALVEASSAPDASLTELRRLFCFCMLEFGAEHTATLMVAKDLAELSKELQNDLEAESLYAFVLASATQQSIGSPVDSMLQLEGLAVVEQRLGRPELALALFEELVHWPGDQGAHPNPFVLDFSLQRALELCEELGLPERGLSAARQWLEVAGEGHPERENVEGLVLEFERQLAEH